LDLVLLDYEDKNQRLQSGKLKAWRAVLGHARATEVRRDHLDVICRKWRQTGPSWPAGTRTLADGRVSKWDARQADRVRPLDVGTINRYVALLRRAFNLGQGKRGLLTPLTFPHFAESTRGEYISEDQSLAIRDNFKARNGADVKGRVFRLAYLVGIRKGQLLATQKRHVLITGLGTPSERWKLRWQPDETKTGKKTGKPHEVALGGEALDIVKWAWSNRLPDCDYLFHVRGKPLGDLRSELRRTCEALGIPYGRGTGIIFHDTRHSAVTNLVASGTAEPIAMSITGHVTGEVFRRYNVKRDDVQEAALARQQEHLSAQRGTTPKPTALP
jgi:integrase